MKISHVQESRELAFLLVSTKNSNTGQYQFFEYAQSAYFRFTANQHRGRLSRGATGQSLRSLLLTQE